MQGLSIRKVVACRERLAEKLNELNRLEQHDIDEGEQPALPLPDAPDLEAARRAAADAYGQLLAALGSHASVDAIHQEAEALMALAPHVQSATLHVVEEAQDLEQDRQWHADSWPVVLPQQGWARRLGYALWRVLRFFLATCLIDLAIFLGRPPFQGLLRVFLVISYWYFTPYIVLRCLGKAGTSWTWLAINLAIYIALVYYLFCEDLPARQRAAGELSIVAIEAAALRDRLPQDTPAPSLRAALAALADCCSATLQRDRDRLNALRSSVPAWQRPFRALWHMAQQAAATLRRTALQATAAVPDTS